mgnify:CR=1 FL=1
MHTKCAAMMGYEGGMVVVYFNIGTYIEMAFVNEVLKCFRGTQELYFVQIVMAYTCILKGCGILGSLDVREDTNANIWRQRVFGRIGYV